MSNFRDTFTKEDQGEKMLDYDESAFYYFATSVLIVVLIPCFYNFIKYGLIGVAKSIELPFNHSKNRTIKNCQCSVCQHKLQEKEKLVRPSFSQRFHLGRLMQLLVICMMGFCLYYSLEEIKNSPEGLKKFDPFEILDIPYGSTDKEIRSAFRKMSVKFHPDKNPGDNLAAGRYMKITKAYEALTSELARSNWEKYGNPDGPQPLRFAIGLPRFLLKTENHVTILCVFFLLILVIMPGSIYYWMKNSRKVDKNGVLTDNYPIMARILNENIAYKNLLIVLAQMPEFAHIQTPKIDQAELISLHKKYEEFLPKLKEVHPRVAKIVLLLAAHMFREHVGPKLQADQKDILQKCCNLIESCVEFGYQIYISTGGRRMGLRAELFWIDLAQVLTQGLWFHESNLMSLPHVNTVNLKDFQLGKKGKTRSLRENYNLDKLESKFGVQKFTDIKEAFKVLPNFEVTAEAFVEGEKEIMEGDVMTVKVTIIRKNLAENEEAGFVHSNTFPFLKYEKVWVFIGDINRNIVFYVAKLQEPYRVLEDSTFKYPLGMPPFGIKAGTHNWDIIVKSDSYYDEDITVPLSFTVLPAGAIKREVFVHPDDEALDNQTSWVQKALLGDNEETESSDEDDIPELEEIEEKEKKS